MTQLSLIQPRNYQSTARTAWLPEDTVRNILKWYLQGGRDHFHRRGVAPDAVGRRATIRVASSAADTAASGGASKAVKTGHK